VPVTGLFALLVALVAAATAFVAVSALCLGLGTARLAERWKSELAGAATVRIPSALAGDRQVVAAVLRALRETPGIRSARALDDAEQRALLAPWLGAEAGLADLPLPRLIAVEIEGDGPDPAGLQARLQGEAPGAVYDDHGRWRRPLRRAANGLLWLAGSVVLIALMLTAALLVLAARATLSSQRDIMVTLRLIGADDRFIMRAFVSRLTWRAFLGAVGGTAAGLAATGLLAAGAGDSVLGIGLRPHGAEWILPALVPAISALIAWAATRAATRASLRDAP